MATTATKPSQQQQVAVLEPKLATGGKLQPIVPQTWNEAVQMAGAFVRAGMVPKHFENNTEKATVAILAGLEVGLTPMAALQSIAVINNMPTIYGDGMLGLVRASGWLEDIDEGVDFDKKGSPTHATCRVKRKGEKTWGVHVFTMSDADRAGLTGKAGPWKQYPHRMLQMRARAWALRDKFADVLKGLKSAEEVQDMIDITPAAETPPEPRREDFTEPSGEKTAQTVAPNKSPPPANSAPPGKTDSGEGGQSANAAEAGGDPTVASGQPAVTDGTDQNALIEFETFETARPFFAWASDWLNLDQHPERTVAEAKAFEEHYRAKLKEYSEHSFQWVKDAVADVMVQYNLVLAKAQETQG